jgi:hypothetical protein
VRKTFPPFRLAVCALCALSFLGLQVYGQDRDRDKDHTNDHQNGIVKDWSSRHLVYPRFGRIESLIALENDPRAILSWQAATREDWHRARNPRHERGTQGDFQRDWSISLGGGSMALAMYPAKYTFSPTAIPTCIVGAGVPTPDFIVFTVNVAGSTIQPNIVAFQDLYSGTLPATGLCNTQRPSYFTGDTVTSAAAFWSYNVTAADGVVSTSPTLSLDGTRVAFVERGVGTEAHFHVLAWNGGTTTAAGDGVTLTDSQDVLVPADITTTFVSVAPVAGSGTATDLPLGITGSDTLSSPYVDYTHDFAYVGNDVGVLFRIKNVFCTLPSCAGAAPSLDGTWGTGGALATTCSGKLTGPVQDSGTGNIFVGCSDGTLYGFTTTGAGVALTGSPLTVGNGGATGGIVDPPMIDAVNGLVYVGAGDSAGGTSVLVQAGTASFTSPAPVTAKLGAGGLFNLHAPAFNNAYYSSGFTSFPSVEGTTAVNVETGPATSNWQILDWAASGVSGDEATLYGVGFTSSAHVMTAGAAANFLEVVSGGAASEFSPVTEFLNASTDQLFVSGLTAVTPNFLLYNLTDFPTTLFPNVLFPIDGSAADGGSQAEGNGTTGITVDNESGDAQASSVYFGVPSLNTAVKLTQSTLQ